DMPEELCRRQLMGNVAQKPLVTEKEKISSYFRMQTDFRKLRGKIHASYCIAILHKKIFLLI
ncbi:MAG TPA: hypothetical protein PK610_01450, partial [Flavobacteriales bacterium]|nr:hypothetical protein [Flavobacteriales bacterium]